MSGILLTFLGQGGSGIVSLVEYLVVAGGAGGGRLAAGGGGAGGYLTSASFSVTSGTPITVTVGAGGSGSTTTSAKGSDGSNSIFQR